MNNVNLLPPAATWRFRRRNIINLWTRTIGILCLLSLGALRICYSKSQSYAEQLDSELTESDDARAILRINDARRTRLRAIKQVAAQQSLLRSSHSPLTILSLINELKQKLGDKFQVEQLDFSDSLSIQGGKSLSEGKVQLRVVTDGTENSSIVLNHFSESGFFADVRLGSALEKTGPMANQLRFTINCSF